MKKIINWRKASVCDIETDGFLDIVTKMHVTGIKLHGTERVIYIKGDDHIRVKSMLKYHIDNGIPIVGHNFSNYDVPVIEKLLGIDLTELMVIDTLHISWYLNTNHRMHSIEALSKDYKTDLSKYQVAEGEWLNLSWEDAVLRVTGDVLLNEIIWEDFKGRLIDMYSLGKEEIDSGNVGGKRMSPEEIIYLDQFAGDSVEQHIDRLLTFLMFKADAQRLQEATGWYVDQPYLKENIVKLEELVSEAANALEKVMPKVPKYVKRKEPVKKFLKNGGLSVSGTKWQDLIDRYSKGEVDEVGTKTVLVENVGEFREITGYAEPNINSHQQVKDFLFSYGWIPATFKYVKDEVLFDAWIASKPEKGAKHWEWSNWKSARPEDRAIPQIRVDVDGAKELCDSVEELAEQVPEITYLEEYSVIKNRLDSMKGILARIDDDGYVKASCHGFTNTLRLKHRAPIVNLPAANKKYSEPIRGCLIAQDGYILMGSDLSSLENRVGHHFMMPHDPEYVETMDSDDYDAHLFTAWAAGMITGQDIVDYKDPSLTPIEKNRISLARAKGKTCLPVDTTEVLTDSGWKAFNDINLKDKVLSYRNGITEFCSISDTVFYKDQELLSLKVGKSWDIESTADHRWLVNKRKFVNKERVFAEEYWSTESLNSECNIITSAPYVGGSSKVTEGEAAFIGWYLSDGYLVVSPLTRTTSQGLDGRRQQVKLSLAQKVEGKFYKEMMESIDLSGVSYGEIIREDGVSCITVSSPSAREFLNRVGLPIMGKHEVDYTEWLLGLSPESLKSFFNAFWLGDGHTSSNREVYGSKVIFQNSGNIANAIKLAGELLGMTSTSCTDETGFSVLRFKDRGHVTMQRAVKRHSRVTDVFCLTTDNGNFIIRQGGVITITGNCNYASVYGAGAATIAAGAGVSLEEGQALHTGYWELNWSVKNIAAEQVVVEDKRGNKWLVNPINGILYSVRSEKDYFSTLVQGTGSWLFNMWEALILRKQKETWGKATQTAEMHDEIVWSIKNNPKYINQLTEMVFSSIRDVSDKYMLRRELGCDVQTGKRYSEIH